MPDEVYIVEFPSGSRAYSSLELAQQSTKSRECDEIVEGWVWHAKTMNNMPHQAIVKSIIDEYPPKDPAFR